MFDRTWIKGEPSPYQLKDITHFPDWRNIIVWDAFFNNLAGGFYVFLMLAWFFSSGKHPEFNLILPFAMTLGLGILFFDLLLLICDLGDPIRFFHSLRVFHPTSVLSVGVWALSTFALCLSVAVGLFWLVLISNHTNGFMNGVLTGTGMLMRIFAGFAFVAACVVVCYKGVVFSASSQPGVKNARWLTTWMVSDAILMGCGLLAVFAFFCGAYRVVTSLAIPMMVLIVIRCIGFYLLRLDVHERAVNYYRHGWNFWAGFVVYLIAGAVPFVFDFFGPLWVMFSGWLVLFAGIWERYWLIGMTKPLTGPNADLT